MPTEISIGNVTDTFKKAMREVIAPFFNGATHKIYDLNVLFPVVSNIQFYDPLQDVGQTSIITIGFFQRLGSESEKLKVKHRLNPQKYAFEKRSDLLLDAFVTGPRVIGDPSGVGTPEFYHKVWSCLTAVLHTSIKSFADRQIFNVMIDDMPVMIANPPIKNTILLVGRMNCQLRYQYAPYNLT